MKDWEVQIEALVLSGDKAMTRPVLVNKLVSLFREVIEEERMALVKSMVDTE